MKYPRVCAHRGFNTIAPENSLPAFGAAVALGAQEIEFDLLSTKDGVLVLSHNNELEQSSNGLGNITDHTYEELLNYDFGEKFSDKYKGLQISTFEQILKKFGGQAIMNVHLKDEGVPCSEEKIRNMVDFVRRYDCAKHVYFMLQLDEDIRKFKQIAPEISVCVGHDFLRNWAIVDRAVELGAEKVQFYALILIRK